MKRGLKIRVVGVLVEGDGCGERSKRRQTSKRDKTRLGLGILHERTTGYTSGIRARIGCGQWSCIACAMREGGREGGRD